MPRDALAIAPLLGLTIILAACTSQKPNPWLNVDTTNLPAHLDRSPNLVQREAAAFANLNNHTTTLTTWDEHNAQPAIQQLINTLPPQGGTVQLPAATLEIRAPITINRSNVRLTGAGPNKTTIRFADDAMKAQILDCIQITGPNQATPISTIKIDNLTIDANYWNQPGSYNPRAIDSDNARQLRIQNVNITNAFVGLTFGLGVTNAHAQDVTITHWHNDAFNASGDGSTGGASDIVFIRCTAKNSFNERAGGKPGNRNNAWEIEDGATNVTLINCRVENCSGNGFAVRNHFTDDGCTTRNITFIDCHARNVHGNAFHIIGGPHPNAVTDITLRNCSSDSVSTFTKNPANLTIENSTFDATVSIGPTASATVNNTTFRALTLWCHTATLPTPAPDGSPQRTDTAIALNNCTIQQQLSVFGDPHNLTLNNTPAPPNSNLPTPEESTF